MKESEWPLNILNKVSYVAGFMFSPDLDEVVLIKKKKPLWQKDKLNAVGGKIESNETPIQAMVREFEEEASLKTLETDWKPLCIIGDEKYEVYFFYCKHDKWADAVEKTDEGIWHVDVDELSQYRLIENLKWLIPLAKDYATKFSGSITTCIGI